MKDLNISIFTGGYRTTAPSYAIDNWDELVDLLTTPQVGTKDGQYIIRGFCSGIRQDSDITSIDLIVIDGDQTISNGGSCCPPEPVHDVLKINNITHVIYSSYSADVVNSRFKWRVVIPCPDLIDADTVRVATAEIISLLHKNGLLVRNVSESNVISQPWYTPRCPEHCIDDFYYAYYDGSPYRITGELPLPTAVIHTATEGEKLDDKGIFSWDYVTAQFAAGTLHQGIKSACGWLIHTTDWADSQIKQFLLSQINSLCPDNDKTKRANETKEIDDLIKYCREKSGKITKPAGWSDYLTTAAELEKKEFQDPIWAVEGLIPEGLTILAGDPKAGKSLMAVDICSSIASGEKAFGQLICKKGTALYASLEDPERRVKDRIKKQCDRWPETFKLLTGGLPPLGPEFYRVADEILITWPDLRAVIIDTMQFIIPPKKNGVADYDHYYGLLAPLHDWSITNHVAVVLITHKSKAKNNDGENPFAGIIGSVAIQGTADTMLMLSKNHAKKDINDPNLPDGFLQVTGRETEPGFFAMDMDAELKVWTLLKPVQRDTDVTNANWTVILMVLRDKKMPLKEVVIATKLNKSTAGSCLRRMLLKGLVAKTDDGFYAINGHDYAPKTRW